MHVPEIESSPLILPDFSSSNIMIIEANDTANEEVQLESLKSTNNEIPLINVNQFESDTLESDENAREYSNSLHANDVAKEYLLDISPNKMFTPATAVESFEREDLEMRKK